MSTLAILARAPLPGASKTRLIPALGAEGAARLQQRMLDHAVARALDAGLGAVVLWCWPHRHHPAFGEARWRGRVQLRDQPEGDLGNRMLAAVREAAGPGGVLVIGTDSPALSGAHLRQAAAVLAAGHDAVLAGAEDGGYVLIGLTAAHAALFSDMPWGSDAVARLTRERLGRLGLRWAELAPCWDVDLPQDLPRLAREFPALLAGLGITG